MINPINGTDKTKLNMDNNQSDKQPNRKNDGVVVFDDLLKEAIEEFDNNKIENLKLSLMSEANKLEVESNELENQKEES